MKTTFAATGDSNVIITNHINSYDVLAKKKIVEVSLNIVLSGIKLMTSNSS